MRCFFHDDVVASTEKDYVPLCMDCLLNYQGPCAVCGYPVTSQTLAYEIAVIAGTTVHADCSASYDILARRVREGV